MAFATTALIDMPDIGTGELVGNNHIVLSATTFEDGLIMGRFAKMDTGSVDNLDNSATPVIAGVVLRDVPGSVEQASAADAATTTKIEYARFGIVTVEVVTGDTPAFGGTVYAHNDVASATDYGKATTTSTNNVDTGAEFLYEIQTDVWAVRLK